MGNLLKKVMKENNYFDLEANMYSHEEWISMTEPKRLNKIFTNILNEVGFTIVNHMEHNFPIQGYTCIWLLAESHLSIHTFPNKNTCYVQISSCNEKKLLKFITKLNNIKESKKTKTQNT